MLSRAKTKYTKLLKSGNNYTLLEVINILKTMCQNHKVDTYGIMLYLKGEKIDPEYWNVSFNLQYNTNSINLQSFVGKIKDDNELNSMQRYLISVPFKIYTDFTFDEICKNMREEYYLTYKYAKDNLEFFIKPKTFKNIDNKIQSSVFNCFIQNSKS
jgi:hypothetical protein